MDKMLQTVPANTSDSPARSLWLLNGKPTYASHETYNTLGGAARTPCRQRRIIKFGPNGGGLRGRDQRGACIRANTFDHRAKAVRTLRREMLAQPHILEQLDGVGRQNVVC